MPRSASCQSTSSSPLHRAAELVEQALVAVEIVLGERSGAPSTGSSWLLLPYGPRAHQGFLPCCSDLVGEFA